MRYTHFICYLFAEATKYQKIQCQFNVRNEYINFAIVNFTAILGFALLHQGNIIINFFEMIMIIEILQKNKYIIVPDHKKIK